MIELKNVSKTFQVQSREVTAVKDVSLKVEKGEIFGIVGASGAGKSTLVRCMNLLEVPTSGEVLFDGVDLVKLSQKELLQKRQSISMIFQGFNLFSQRSVLKNICYPLEIAGVKKEAATKKAQELLELVGLGDKANAYPSQLSGGQKQRVAIARALATDPKVLLCDEATSALDPGTTLQILNLLQEVREKLGVTVIIITHEMEVVQRICDKVAVMNQGQVVETGTTEQIFLNPQSPITRKMLLTEQNTEFIPSNGPIIRISFDGQAASLPLLSKLILESQAPINILKADTEEIKGKAFGQMIVQLPEKEALVEKIKEILVREGLDFEEGSAYLGCNND
ncbi:ATP-binding cassette domain-containing protein [Enterococcus cecorum]|uniref:methionine ABC transporter ATP-binding protein n=1 Tax=Enterococcus cecorum TaxID=44008 RepID=UPI001FAD4BEB|nr:ATP-binding cassette domain-containing protein [Enterococcus cecorum]MCJ0571414.1 ATP-binding cassette domain-containing protein [Enterococcus cecorum]MCJ0577819.1 ATP-binding cassette domain-containing protein [Enterococcus cecorum]MCJ0583533.1 ATP-binding cassette domain-containing protein [Enterococcus cecorum]MCJ0585927.1 ATP-binding cassette domain-containing protein [Enterococcus cecorum]MCJ0589129.1 ATP-binding cassette domain-containing protein [Enterococcus cecorum]